MLSPEYLDAAPGALLELLRQLEDDILRDAARRIGSAGQITDTAQYQLWRLDQLEGLREDVIKLLAQYSGQTEEELRRIFQTSGTDALAQDDEIYQAAGLTPPPVNDSPALVNLLNAGYDQTRGTWQNLTATTANTVTGQFEQALDRAWLQVASGAFDYRSAIKRAVDALAQDMAYITYPSGHQDTLEVAARRAVLTGVNQTAGKLQVRRMEDMGCSFVETTAHPGARPEHALWQGRVFHRGGAVTVDGVEYPDFVSATGYGTGPGLCGWNCRHNFFPFFPGISPRAYTQEKLAEYSARDMEYQGKKYTRYELSQIQRGLERGVRKWKRRYLAEEAAGLDTTQAAARLRTAREKLRQFARETGLDLDGARIGVSGFGRSQASSAVWTARKELAKYTKYLYNRDGTVVVTDDWTSKTHPHIESTYKPFAVVDTLSQNGSQRNRSFFDAEGHYVKQISTGPHGNPKRHPFGKNGEHAHDILWEDGHIVGRPVRELTDIERKENADIL